MIESQGDEPRPQSLRPMKWVAGLAFLALVVGFLGFAAGRVTAPNLTNTHNQASPFAAGIVQDFLEDEDEVADAEARLLDGGSKRNTMMKLLDQIRCMHDVPKFTWDAALAQSAQSWADTGKHSHSTALGAFSKYGENICFGFTVKKCVQFWYDEIKKTNGGAMSSANYGASHYGQLVWKATHNIGCGFGVGNIIVCQFKTRGNWAGQCPDCYKDNVFAPTKSKSDCA